MPFDVSRDTPRSRLLSLKPAGQKLEMWCWATCSEMIVKYLREHFSSEFPSQDRTVGGEAGDNFQGELANLRLDQANERLGVQRQVDCTRVENEFEYQTCNRGGWPYFDEFNGSAQSTQWSSIRYVLEEHGIALREDGWPRTIEGPLSRRQLEDLTFEGPPEFQKRLMKAEDCALSWPMLTGLIDAECPVAFCWRTSKWSAHLMVVGGYAVTPPDQKWVVICDPLPPNSGDIYMVPYDYWVGGPYGRHWRDVWVVRPTDGQRPLPPYSIDDLRVGRELTRSTFPLTEGLPPRPQEGESHELSPEDRRQVHAIAGLGLRAVQNIASQTPQLAAAMSMGGAASGILGGLIQHFVGAPAADLTGREAPEIKSILDPVDPTTLELAETYIPVFGVTSRDLKKWDGVDPDDLLTAPREVVWEVVRNDRDLYNFYTTIRIRRFEDKWRLAGIGRLFLGISLALEQLFASLRRAQEGDEPLSALGLVNHLAELGLLEAIAALVPRDEIEDMLDKEKPHATGKQVAKKAVDRVREQGTETRDLETLAARLSIEEGAQGRIEALLQELLRILGEEPLDATAIRDLARRLDQETGVEHTKHEIVRPKYVLDVLDLYQQFVAFTDEELLPIYPSEFYHPGRLVPRGDRTTLLQQLRELAHKEPGAS